MTARHPRCRLRRRGCARGTCGSDYEQFHVVHWVLAVITFLVIVLVWNDYMIAAIAYFWTPTLADAFFPFTLLALQLTVPHSVYPDERLWFLSTRS